MYVTKTQIALQTVYNIYKGPVNLLSKTKVRSKELEGLSMSEKMVRAMSKAEEKACIFFDVEIFPA